MASRSSRSACGQRTGARDAGSRFSLSKLKAPPIGSDLGGVRISVDNIGKAWVITNKKQIFRRAQIGTAAGQWELVPGTLSDVAALASDSGNHLAWGIDATSSGQEGLWSRAEQPGNSNATSGSDTPSESQWPFSRGLGAGGPNASLAALKNGDAIVVDNNGTIWAPIDRYTARKIALRAAANNQFVCADNAGASSLIANRGAVGPWETYDLLDNEDGSVSLVSWANHRFVTAENAGASPLIANRIAVGPWETKFDPHWTIEVPGWVSTLACARR